MIYISYNKNIYNIALSLNLVTKEYIHKLEIHSYGLYHLQMLKLS